MWRRASLALLVLGVSACDEPPPQQQQGTPTLVVTPEVVDFGEISATTEPVSGQTVTLANDGDGDLILGDITLQGNGYSLPGIDRSGSTLRPGTSVDLTVQLLADRDGEFEARLGVEWTDGERVQVPVIADVRAGKIDLSPMSHDFGDPVVGCRPSVTVTIENNGREALTLESVELDGNDEWAAESTPEAGHSLDPGESIEMVVRYQPDDPEPDDATLVVRSSDGESPEAVAAFEGRSHFESEATETFEGGSARYDLAFGAVWETIRVRVNGERVFAGWSYDDSEGPALVFQAGAAPDVGDTLRVVYIALGSC